MATFTSKFGAFFAFLIFFVLFYFESERLGPIKLSFLWKSVLLTVLLLFVVVRTYRPPVFVTICFLLALKQLVFAGTDGMAEAAIEAMKYLGLPVTYMGIKAYLGHSDIAKEQLERWLYLLVVFVAVGNSLVLVGLFDSRLEADSLVAFGLDQAAFSGIFQKQHAAASIFAVCTCVMLFFLAKPAPLQRKAILLACMFICVVCLYQTYVRTGFAMLIVGIVYLSFSAKKGLLRLSKQKLGGILILLCFTWFVSSDQTMQAKLADQRIGQQTELMAVGSGRPLIWLGALTTWRDSSISGKLIGLGPAKTKDIMETKVGIRVFAHNGFLEALQTNGVLGLGLLLTFFYSLLKFSFVSCDREYGVLLRAVVWMYAAFYFFQGGNIFLLEVIIVLLALLGSEGSRLQRLRNE